MNILCMYGVETQINKIDPDKDDKYLNDLG